MGYTTRLIKEFIRKRNGKVTFASFTLFALIAIFASYIAPFGPLQVSVGPVLSPPSVAHIFGTDQLGEDVFSQVIHGTRVALIVGIGSTIIALIIALAIGLSSGYIGGILDDILMRATDITLSIPSFVLIILVVILFGSTNENITLVIGLFSWPTLARIIRSQVLSIREREFILAARAIGEGSFRIMVEEIMPNVWFALLPAVTLQVGTSILTEAGLSFLGLGDPNTMSWGRILSFASQSIYTGNWWGVLFPGIAIILTILLFNLTGDELSKLFNPKVL